MSNTVKFVRGFNVLAEFLLIVEEKKSTLLDAVFLVKLLELGTLFTRVRVSVLIRIKNIGFKNK